MSVPSGFRKAFRTFADPSDTAPPDRNFAETTTIAGAIPPAANWRSRGILSPVRFQGNCNTCTSFATASIIEAIHRLRTGNDLRLAPTFIHRCLLQRDCRTGASGKQVLSAAAARGVALGFNGDDPFPEAQCDTAALFTFQSWSWVDRLDAILAAIARNGPVLADLFIDEAFLSLKASRIYELDPGRPSVLHSVAVVGFDRNEGWAIVQNSFGEDWCDAGFGRIRFGSGGFLVSRGAFQIVL